MSQLIETIKIYKGRVYNIAYHDKRLNRSRYELFDRSDFIKLRPLINIPAKYGQGLVKCRVIYDKDIHSISYENYTIQSIDKLQCVYTKDFRYKHKFLNRTDLNKLYQMKSDADDIIIINNNKISDSYYCNLAFYDGTDWITPKDCLLEGTARAKLIESAKIISKSLSYKDIKNFSYVSLFNAMIPIKTIRISCDKIKI